MSPKARTIWTLKSGKAVTISHLPQLLAKARTRSTRMSSKAFTTSILMSGKALTIWTLPRSGMPL